MYKYKQLRDGVYVVSLDNHVNLIEALSDFCRAEKIEAGSVNGIAAQGEATFRFLDPAVKKYVDRTLSEQMEATCIIGNISVKDGAPYLHVHVTCSRSDYSCVGGHLLEARINGACELFVEKFAGVSNGRRFDPDTGLTLYDL